MAACAGQQMALQAQFPLPGDLTVFQLCLAIVLKIENSLGNSAISVVQLYICYFHRY